ncbi:MAG: transporter substrate-binding domain-containing protein [Clostridiales bacterium]|nr:transporter substrate-binding domain-containing protein [Clostridiales bacterium]
MKKFKKIMSFALAGIMTAACFSGCGQVSSTSETDSTSSSALTLDYIREKGTLSVATEAAYEPFEYLDRDTIIGYNADLFHIIAEDLGVELDYQDLPFQGILAGLSAKKYNMVGTTLGVTAERTAQYTMTYPIERGTTTYLKRKGDDSIQSAEDIAGKIVGTQTACYNEEDIKEYNEQLISEGKEGYAELKTYDSFAEAYMELKNGQVDLVVQNYASNAAMALRNPDVYELVKGENGDAVTAGEETWLSWAVRKEDTELSDFINSEIKKFKEDGTMAELQEKWFGDVCADILPESNYIGE